MIVAASTAAGQSGFQYSIGGGMYASIGSLGTRYAGKAHLAAVPTLVAGFDVMPSASPIGFRFVVTENLAGGYTSNPTDACVNACTRAEIQQGRFWAVTASAVKMLGKAGRGVELEFGGGVRRYSFAEYDCVCAPLPPNWDPQVTHIPLAFHHPQTAPTVRVGVGYRVPLGTVGMRLSIVDHLSRGPTDQLAQDIVVAANVGLGGNRKLH